MIVCAPRTWEVEVDVTVRKTLRFTGAADGAMAEDFVRSLGAAGAGYLSVAQVGERVIQNAPLAVVSLREVCAPGAAAAATVSTRGTPPSVTRRIDRRGHARQPRRVVVETTQGERP